MDGHVNVFVTIVDANGKVVDTNMPIKLHVTGESDKLPANRIVKAEHGYATFRDVFYKKPAKYIFHISGHEVETFNLPIFKKVDK